MSDTSLMERPVAATPTAAPAATTVPVTRLPFVFSGKGGEFFKIWIVNVVLTILTLGIYSAWAKVRTKQYFYGNTRLDGTSFSYTAKPLQILKGRLIAAVFFVAYMVASQVSPIIGGLLLVGLMLVLPWVVVVSLRFNAHYSEYRGIRFGFHGSVGKAYQAYLLWPLAAILTLGLLLPMAWRAQAQLMYGGHSFGDKRVEFSGNLSPLYQLYGLLISLGFGFGIISAVITAVTGGFAGGNFALVGALMGGLYLLLVVALTTVSKVGMANYAYNHCAIAEHKFVANWQYVPYFKLMLGNTLLVLFTLGLATPVAQIRNARYAAQHLHLDVKGDLNGALQTAGLKNSALGDGVSDLFNIDVAL